MIGRLTRTSKRKFQLRRFAALQKKAKCELKLANANQRIIDLFLMSNLAAIFEGHEDYLGAAPD